MPPAISVIICTHNRAGYLGAAIDSVLAQDVPATAYEVFVVDNRCEDHTRTVVDARPRVRYLHEPTLGLSHARNTGWHAASGTWIALLDDDTIAQPGWLEALLNATGSESCSRACVGGRVTPLWESPRPSWLSDKLALSLTVADWSEEPHAIRDLTQEWLVGANIAFRRTVLDRLGGFPSSLGRVGGRLMSGEEIFLQRRLVAEGNVCWYEPRATVAHRIPAARMEPTWFRRRYLAQGRSDAAIWRLERAEHGERVAARMAAELRPLIRSGFGVPGLLARVRDPGDFEDHCGSLWRLGFVSGLMGIA